MLIPILITLAVIVVVFLIVVATRPAEFRVSRSASIGAPPELVFIHVNDLRLWEAWSPWAKLDPNAKNTFTGPSAGTGASLAWDGNQKIGAGQMTITESRSNELIRFRLEFFRPFKGVSTSEFTFKPENGRTLVTWTMSGKNNFIGKAMGLFINCDGMVGRQFEQGLAQMNAVATATAAKVMS